jgi:hypothetical protein
VGDDAYIIVDMKAFEAAGGFEESDEPCELCGEAQQSDANLLLECERCLRGFHMTCLDPPLSAVPEVGPCAAVLLWSATPPPARRNVHTFEQLVC